MGLRYRVERGIGVPPMSSMSRAGERGVGFGRVRTLAGRQCHVERRMRPLAGRQFRKFLLSPFSFRLSPFALRLSSSRGFTLLEIMIAMVIFSIVMSSLFMSFRTAMKAYNIGATHSEAGQMARYTITQVSDDLKNVFYKAENQYNVARRQRESLQEQREQQAMQSGSKYSPVDDETMPELGPKIDLNFRATDGGEVDEVTFVRHQRMKRSEDRMLWNLARIRYFMNGTSLYRSIDDVKAAEVDEEGYEIPKAYEPQVDKIATNVKGFDLKFGYYHDGEWTNAPDWDSNSAQYRNPSDEEEEDENLPATTAAGGMTSATEEKLDELPAWVEISFTFTDPRKEEREKKYKQLVQLPQAQETYIDPELDNPGANDGRRGTGDRGGSNRGSSDRGRGGSGAFSNSRSGRTQR